MTPPDDLLAIIDRITAGEYAEVELQRLRRALTVGDRQDVLQLGKYNVNIGQGKDIQIGDRIYQGADAEAIKEILRDALQALQPNTKLTGIPENLPRSGVVQFVGREREVETLHQQLQENERVAVSAISGMGGIGKTELALQYALSSKQTYQGGICWLRVKGLNVGTQIVQFGRSRLQLQPPEDLDLTGQVGFCWTHWAAGEVLVIFDDVTDYEVIKPYLPPAESRFKVLITTRLRLGKSVKQLEIDVLDESAALALLESLVGAERIQRELDHAKKLCAWLGYLPLGLELVGRYLDRKPDLSLAEMQQRLEKKRLDERSLSKPDTDMTASLGVAAAFELSWEILDEPTKQLGCLLSLFALAPIPWSLVEPCLPEQDFDDLEELRDDNLLNLNLLQRKGAGVYQLHQLIREFLQAKQATLANLNKLRQQFCQAMVAVAQQIPEIPTRDLVIELAPAMPHVAETATTLNRYLSDKDLIKPFEGLGRFYRGQGFYKQAADWYEQCRSQTEQRFGSEHPDVANSISCLASIYRIQGRYPEAEPLYQQALEMRQNLLGAEHPQVADTLNNLALLYQERGRYKEAEPLYRQALEMRQRLLVSEHPDVAESFNNLAHLYVSQKRYTEAESLFNQAVALYRHTIGKESIEVATILNNLAHLYSTQERYTEAESLYIQALTLNKRLLGEEHLNVAANLNNLAFIYNKQGRQLEAEQLYKQVLAIVEKLLGAEHHYLAFTLKNLAELYALQGRYAEAEPLYIQGLAILEKNFGAEHPDTIKLCESMHQLRNSKTKMKEG